MCAQDSRFPLYGQSWGRPPHSRRKVHAIPLSINELGFLIKEICTTTRELNDNEGLIQVSLAYQEL